MEKEKAATPRRYEALGYIMERIARAHGCPSFEEVGRQLQVSKTRVRHYVQQLVREGIVDTVPGAQRNIIIRDWHSARAIVASVLGKAGPSLDQPFSSPIAGCSCQVLPLLPLFKHLPAVD